MYESEKHSFIELCMDGKVLLEEIDDFVDKWHESSQDVSLHEYLGMTWEEYSAWVAEPDILPFIVTAHVENKPLAVVIEQNNNLPLAARADSPKKAQMILDWLKSKGKI